jgi:hypothetical protein
MIIQQEFNIRWDRYGISVRFADELALKVDGLWDCGEALLRRAGRRERKKAD